MPQILTALEQNAVTRLAGIASLDAKSVAVTTIYEVPPGYAMVVDHVEIICTAFTVGSKSTQAVASFGGNHATYDDYLNTVTYQVAALGTHIKDSLLDTAVPIYAAGTNFKISIETGSDASAETWSVDLFGYLIPA